VTPKIPIHENVALAPCTTLCVGGSARFFLQAKTEEQICDGLLFARKGGCSVFVLGRGSNLVVADAGFPGLVIRIELAGIEEADEGKVFAAAGEEWDAFVNRCVGKNLAGIECLSGIPGTVGGTPIQNVGAYGQEVSEVISSVRVLDRVTGSIADMSNGECKFGYRSSIFNTSAKDRYIVLKVGFALHPDGEPTIEYRDLQQVFKDVQKRPSLNDVREAVLTIRESKGMVLHENDPESRSAGSFFKNPVLQPGQAGIIEDKARAAGSLEKSEHIQRFATSGGEEKLSAAWLIARAGFHKGFVSGRVGISSKHSLALINLGNASAQEIVDLMKLIQERVQSKFGIELQPEPVFVGFE
jgi:UDP-N-acetylmuramate dehydrogenase